MAKYLDPKADLTFKRVFGEHKDLLISFLNALLPLQPGQEITDIEYLPAEMVPLTPDKKDTIVDVRCTEKAGRQFLVEMQMYWTCEFRQRTLFNTCKAYSRPLEKGKEYRDLKPIYTLSLVNDIAFPEYKDEFYHEFVPTHRNHQEAVIDDFSMIFVELPKFRPTTWADRKMAVLWLRFLTEINEKVRQAPAEMTEDHLVAKALSIVEESAYSDAELYTLDRYWDWVSRERMLINGAARRHAEGFAEGRAEGEAIGMQKTALANALKMKAKGFSVQDIAEITGLSEEQVLALGE